MIIDYLLKNFAIEPNKIMIIYFLFLFEKFTGMYVDGIKVRQIRCELASNQSVENHTSLSFKVLFL